MDETRSSKSRRSKRKAASNETIEQLNVRYRICHLFKEKEKNAPHVNDNDKICKCGWPKSKHNSPLDDSKDGWNMSRNTFEQIDPEYGQIREKSLFVRLAIDTSLEKVEKILLEAWKIPKPRFIVSIIGGAKYFKLSDRLETNFINGIIDIAQKSDAWLLTSGYNVGIVQLVGHAISKARLTKPNQRITAIGICKWGCIVNVEYETGSKKEKMKEKITDTPVYERKRRQSGQWELEMNHSHYLMLDDGTIRDYEIEDYRTRLAIHLARLQHDDGITTPVVTIMFEGGKDTLANVYYDLRENVPVLIINGSGRAADFLNRWLIITKDLEKESKYQDIAFGIDELWEIDDQSKDPNKKRGHNGSSNFGPSSTTTSKTFHIDYTRNGLKKIFEKYKEQLQEDLENIIIKDSVDEDLIKQVMYCLQPAVRSDITIFNLNSDDDLSETILKSICQSRQKLTKRKESKRNDMVEIDQQTSEESHIIKQKRQKSKSRFRISQKDQKAERFRLLKLAIDWDCIGVAREFIFKNSLNHIMNKYELFQSALLDDRPTFVYEFLKLKIDLCDLFLPKNDRTLEKYQYKLFIQILYDDRFVNHDKNHLKCFIEFFDKTEKRAKIDSVEGINKTFKNLIGDNIHTLYFNTLDKENDHRIQSGLKTEKDLSNREKREIMHDYFMRDLFLWAIVMNRVDMAKVLLSHMKYRICPALIATKIFKQYYRKAPYGDLNKSYDESATYFEQYAINCLNKCDEKDEATACEIILQRNELYGYVTCLQVAADAQDELFIARPCCVEAMNNIWYDKLHPDQTEKRNKLRLFIGFISLGLLAPFFVSYRTTKQDVNKINPSDRKMRANGIDYGDPTLLEYYTLPLSYPAYLRYLPKVGKFYKSLPLKFFYHLITYCFFLLLFSYVLLFKFSPPTNQIPSIHWTEILTIILVSCMLIEETRYFFSQDNLSWLGRIDNYFRDIFKIMIVLSFILFYIGLILRFTRASSEDDFIAARVVMAIDLEIWWLRSLSFIIVLPLLGPHLVSIQKMLKDLLFFMCIIAIVMIGYGVASRSMVYYPVANGFTTATGGSIDTSFDGRSVFYQILYPVYYMMYGQIDNELTTLNSNPNAGWAIATYVLFSIHLILINILLVNMLIAIFTKRFSEVSDDIQNIWRSQQYTLTREYYTRAPFFPPISLVWDIFYLCRMFFFFIQHNFRHQPADNNATVFQIIPEKESTIKDWCEFEEKSTHEYSHDEVKALKNASTKSTSQTDTTNEEIQETIADIKENTNNTMDNLKKVEEDLSNLDVIIEEIKKIDETNTKIT